MLTGGRVISVTSGGGHIAIHKVKPEIKARFLSESLKTDDVVGMAKDFVADAKDGGKAKVEEKWGYAHCYGFSKLCLTTATRTLAKENPDCLIHGCTPGFVLSGMTQGSAASKTPEEGAEIVAYLATSRDQDVLGSGKVFTPEREVLAWDDERYISK
eukprot:TRINITY_DN32885_c0_g1_i2.p1 TRINITY_DN32885_c0_g1~~TRINITY_DN32885_c0_g1_i2.p1  ORF type:complete len:157 (-),score=24.23 TRINITY_DN32885_c0_g1_i2:53-523(-)